MKNIQKRFENQKNTIKYIQKTKSEKEIKCRMYSEKCKKWNKNVKKAGNIADIKCRKQ